MSAAHIAHLLLDQLFNAAAIAGSSLRCGQRDEAELGRHGDAFDDGERVGMRFGDGGGVARERETDA